MLPPTSMKYFTAKPDRGAENKIEKQWSLSMVRGNRYTIFDIT